MNGRMPSTDKNTELNNKSDSLAAGVAALQAFQLFLRWIMDRHGRLLVRPAGGHEVFDDVSNTAPDQRCARTHSNTNEHSRTLAHTSKKDFYWGKWQLTLNFVN